MKRHCYILLFLVLSTTLQAQSKYDCEIYGKITRKLTNDQVGLVLVETPDFFNKELYNSDIQKDGTFRVSFKKYFAGIVFFKFQEDLLELFIQPGEKLQISFDPQNDQLNQLEVVGNSPSVAFNRSMLVWQKKRFSYARYAQPMKEANFEQIQDSVISLKRKEMKRLQQFCLTSQCVSKFLKWARLDILYKEANQLMRYRWVNPLKNGQLPLKVIPKGYNYQFTRKFSLSQPLAMSSQNYRDYIHEHNLHWHYIAYAKNALDPDKIDREKELNWIVRNVEAGLARDLMLAENFGSVASSGDEALIKKLTPMFLEKMQYAPAKDYIKALVKE